MHEMGGCCCCCFPRSSEPTRTPTFYYHPRGSEERQPLSDDHGGPEILLSLVDINLDTSNPDLYTAPLAPIPCNSELRHHQTSPPGSESNYGVAKKGPSDKAPVGGSLAGLSPAVSPGNLDKDKKGEDSEPQSTLELTPTKDFEDDLKKPSEPTITTIEEDDCPICLEEYTEENPKMVTKCEHDFHLCCILEWMERSDRCPVCDKEVDIDETLNI